MKNIWDKVVNFATYWKQALVVAVVGAVMISAVYIQSATHDTHTDYLQRIHEIEVNMLKEQQKQTLRAGDALFEVYQKEKSNSQFKDQIMERQRIIIQQLIKQIEDYKKWSDVDPNSIT